MGKQTKQGGSHFGGKWTKQKLHIIDEYLKTYAMVLKNQKVKKIYIDGFAGSGKTELKVDKKANAPLLTDFLEEKQDEVESSTIDGSALLSLKYDFDEYYFLELDEKRIKALKENISIKFPNKTNKVHFINGDSNVRLKEIVKGISVYSRCLMFLDPYAMELDWSALEQISQCGVVDLWYLFPINALCRILPKDGSILDSNKETITKILGTTEWESALYRESQQLNLFGDIHKERVNFDRLVQFVKMRFATLFPYVSPESKILKNVKRNSPMFLLCFMMTNTSPKAVGAASRIVKSVIESTENL